MCFTIVSTCNCKVLFFLMKIMLELFLFKNSVERLSFIECKSILVEVDLDTVFFHKLYGNGCRPCK